MEKQSALKLHDAAGLGAAQCLRVLLENKANVNTVDNGGRTPLHIAEKNIASECLKALVEIMVDVNPKDKDGQHHVSKFWLRTKGQFWKNS